MANGATRIRISIFYKLVFVTTLGLASAIGAVVYKTNFFFVDGAVKREGDVRQEQAGTMKAQIETKFQSLVDKARIVGGIMLRSFPSEFDRQAALDSSFFSDREIVAAELLTWKDSAPVATKRVLNETHFKTYDLGPEYIDAVRSRRPFPMAKPFFGEIEIQNSSMESGIPLLTIGVPLIQDEQTKKVTTVVLVDILLEGILDTFKDSTSAAVNYLVDREGRIIAHPNEKLSLSAGKIENDFIRWVIAQKQTQTGQKQFSLEGKEFIGAFARTHFDISVISEVPLDEIIAPSLAAKREAIRITGWVLSIAFVFMSLFSMTLTKPLERLVDTTNEIKKGNFEVKANVDTSDEVGQLALAFDQMVDGLKERDKVKQLFGKFHGTGIANKLIKGEISLGGEQKDATVFFSDIRGFTSFSENVRPEEVVEMLNEYFKIMVQIINKNKGVVDKFIGDAIMGVWGAPESFGNDAENAIRACLEMRQALGQLNESRKSRGQPEIRIGMGLHTGKLVAGTIGSDDRMEYTVIGDTVNMASRIESATKAYGTDILISEETCRQVQDHFIVELAGTAEVKGKSEPLRLYKVNGYIDANGHPVIVSTEYSSYKAEASEKVHVA